MTYSGLVQLAPANMIGLTRVRLRVGSIPVLWGLAVGEIVVVWFTFVDTAVLGTFNVGLIGLLANLAVTSLATLIRRNPTSPSERRESVADPR